MTVIKQDGISGRKSMIFVCEKCGAIVTIETDIVKHFTDKNCSKCKYKN